MSLNSLKSSFFQQIKDSLGFSLPEKYSVILKAFGESYIVHRGSMDTLLKLYEVSLEKVNEAIQETGFVIRRETREGTYYMDYVRPKVSKTSDVRSKIAQLLSIAAASRHPVFQKIDFDHLTIGGQRFRDVEFVRKVQEIVANLIRNNNTVITPVEVAPVEVAPVEVAPVEVAPVEVAPVEAGYTIPKGFNLLLPGSEKLWRLYEANIGMVFSKSEISRLTGIDEERIAGTHGNLKTRFPLPTGMIIKSVAREAFVYCREVDFDTIIREYNHGNKRGELSPTRDTGRQQNPEVKNEGEKTSHLESYLSLFTRGTAPYQLYEFYLNALGKKRKISQAKDAGISLANASVSLKAINEKLERNKTGQTIISVEGERGVYKLVAVSRRSDNDSGRNSISEKPMGTSQEIQNNLFGEKFCISEERLQAVVTENRKIFNRERLLVKGKELSKDEFIFCILCWENQEVGIDEEEIRKSLVHGVFMSWVDMVQFKSSIGLKLGDVRIEFSIPVKGSILLKEKNQAEFGRKFLDFMKSQKGKIVSRQDLWDTLVGIGTDENFKLAYNQARQLIPRTESDTIHRLGGRDDWMEFYYGDFDALQALKQQREQRPVNPIAEPLIETKIETTKPIRLILSQEEKTAIIGMNLPFEISFEYGIVDGIELGEVHFNVFILCVLQKGQKVHLGDIFKKLTSREAGDTEIDKIRGIRNQINEKFGSSKTQLFLGSEPGSEYIWFGKLEEGKKNLRASVTEIIGDSDRQIPSQKVIGQLQENKTVDNREGVKIFEKGVVIIYSEKDRTLKIKDRVIKLGDNKTYNSYIFRFLSGDKERLQLSLGKSGKNPEYKINPINEYYQSLGIPFKVNNSEEIYCTQK